MGLSELQIQICCYLKFNIDNPNEQRIKTESLRSLSSRAMQSFPLSKVKIDSNNSKKKKFNSPPKTILNKTCSLFKKTLDKNKNVPSNLSQEFQDLCDNYKRKEATYQQLQQSYNKLKQYYLDINYVLMTYDRQFYKQILQKLYNAMIELKNKFESRLKFKFSRRAEDFGVKEDQKKHQLTEKKQQHQQSLAIPGLSGIKNQTLLIEEAIDSGGPYKIVECENSKIDLQKTTEILFLKELKNCVINCALTKSTVFVTNCLNCTFQLNCHQLRIHNTFDTTFKIFVTSKAIIEDCNRVIFTPYNYQYPNLEQHLKNFERQRENNLWREIQDFNWLKENQKSPHFDLKESV